MEQIEFIEIDQIDFSPKVWRPANHRRDYRWAEFVGSVRQHGLMVEPKVRAMSDGVYEPITGLHALLAVREAGHRVVKCVVSQMGDVEATVAAFHARLAETEPAGLVLENAWSISNLERELLARGEVASCRTIAARIGRSKSFVNYSLAIAVALPRERFLAIAAEEGVPEAVAVTLPKAAAAGLAKVAADRRDDMLRGALRVIESRGAATNVVTAADVTNAPRTYLLQFIKHVLDMLRRLILQFRC